MGFGGHLTWTAAAREIVGFSGNKNTKVIPVEVAGQTIINIVKSDIFFNNPNFTYDINYSEKFILPMNLPQTNYCKVDTPTHATQRGDKHIIEQICEFYGINNPELKCDFFLTETEKNKVTKLLKNIEGEFITIEPHSKCNYTPNRAYSFKKWQNIVNELSKTIQVVQVGKGGLDVLENAVDFTGVVTFREASELIGRSRLFLSTEGGLVHAATSTNTKSLVILTGYQTNKMVQYPQNINVDISSHGPCGLKIGCEECAGDIINHNEKEIVNTAIKFLESLDE